MGLTYKDRLILNIEAITDEIERLKMKDFDTLAFLCGRQETELERELAESLSFLGITDASLHLHNDKLQELLALRSRLKDELDRL
jgi:hypothetical protein